MMIPLKYAQNGNSLCIMLPKEAVAALQARKGDVVFLTDAPDGKKAITPYNPEFETAMRAGREFMNDYRDTLRALAKR